MAEAIRSYMDEKTTAFQFNDTLTEIMYASEDKTVQTIRQALWFHYDDCKDHKIVASKEEWDYFNRLLLLLASDAGIEVVRSWRRWHISQAVAAVCLAWFAYLAARTGFGEHLFALACPFGVVSMALAWFNSRRRKKAIAAIEVAVTPFSSVSTMLSVRRRVTGFVKARYPRAITGRRIRDPIIDKLMWIPWTMVRLMFSPIALFIQMLPERESETRIKMPEPEGAGDTLPARA